jgi:hypothetical protein
VASKPRDGDLAKCSKTLLSMRLFSGVDASTRAELLGVLRCYVPGCFVVVVKTCGPHSGGKGMWSHWSMRGRPEIYAAPANSTFLFLCFSAKQN